jgi:hypothetical protein
MRLANDPFAEKQANSRLPDNSENHRQRFYGATTAQNWIATRLRLLPVSIGEFGLQWRKTPVA